MSTPVVQFTADDPYGLWKAGELAYDLGWESNHPDAPPIRLLRTHRNYELLALADPVGRGLAQPYQPEFGILWESNDRDRHWHKAMDPRLTPGGLAIFESRPARAEAIAVLESLGYHYITTYQDTHGPGISFAERSGNQIRPSARERLPSYQQTRRRQAAFWSMLPSLYRNPAYDSVNDPDPRYFTP